ncbi:MAG: hypothetical protein HND39_06200 [Ignavibacteriota bacterium]|jgi:hypothetical protein|nr:MAG: hypothetical protein EDM72_01820 [Chlorobiota bacterium]MBE7475863.1 hypothetical protein [Ignavibacteriales bacterium]MBL1123329.1 hypothetical protein [Ignavibacteriota bacterium]MBV6420334.1 hypothetical protein [Ignavibacteriaceae bacterium]MCE7856530.1 hypothetical protein [Ignavibacteria bacterium CHB3]MEB2295459.1 hypothetical protein [Ignavibacteria bacterium]
MDQSKEQTAAILTQILFSKLAHRFFDKYTDYEMQSGFLKTEIMKVYHNFLSELNNLPETKKK